MYELHDMKHFVSLPLCMGDAVPCASLTSPNWILELQMKADVKCGDGTALGSAGARALTKPWPGMCPNSFLFCEVQKVESPWQGGDNTDMCPIHWTSPKQPKGIAKTFYFLLR